MNLNTCGCCELPDQTPISAFNRPGLSAIVFRVGTYATFRLSMLQRIFGTRALSALKTRSDDDYAITLLDMWATVADVLTFYQERIANEGYLRTALQRDSVLRMARMLDYHLRPGIAATTFLAFTLDKDSSLKIPIGLRVQSVPAEDEQPQIYETLESIVADSRLNSSRILPAPEAFNPLAKGSTSGLLAPGPEGLLGAAALSPGDQLVLFNTSQLEKLTVREIKTDEHRISLRWSGPIQRSIWNFNSSMMSFDRTFRIFGYNAPTQYLEPIEDPNAPGIFTWRRRTFTSYSYSPAGNVLELDTKYEGIAVGSQVLISESNSNQHQLATVIAVSQGQATFLAPGANTSPVQDTVTQLTLSAAPFINDRRDTIIYEIKSPRIRFWGYRYPSTLSGDRVLLPVRRIDSDTVEIGRTIENNVFKSGLQLPIKSVEAGRTVIIRDAIQDPALATVARAEAIGLDVTVTTTSDDFSTAIELRLTPEEAKRLTGLRSATLPSSFTLTSSKRELNVTIGDLPSRTIKLTVAPVNAGAAALQLQARLITSLPLRPEFTQSRVVAIGNELFIFPGVAGLPITFGPTADDPTTAGELGLVSPETIRIDALLSGVLAPFPAITSPFRELSVSFGPIGPRKVTLAAAPSSLNSAQAQLETALRAADPSPAFALAEVVVLGNRLVVIPGTGGSSIQDFLAISVESETSFQLAMESAVLFGNVALSSHGEKVLDEVLGDGDTSKAFQKFELQKNPLTYVPSAEAGGTDSSLEIRVNDIQWTEVPSLFGKGPTEQVYITRLADDGKVTVGFGDGRAGARLPSGRGNVVADYRQGAGLVGRVTAGSLRTTLDMPVGLKSAVNHFAATGGADPESIDQARENAPTTVRTFGRAVSLRDFEDLARASGEVAKALATWVWNREARAVHLTIAAQGGLRFSPTDLSRIHASLNTQRDPNHALFLDNYTEVPLVVKATVRVKPTYVASKVGAAAREALLHALSFTSMRFGQPVSLSDVYAVLQLVDGVISVDIDLFHFKDQSAAFLATRGATPAPVQRTLRIFSARPNIVPMPPALPAELAVIEIPKQDVQIVTSGGLPD